MRVVFNTHGKRFLGAGLKGPLWPFTENFLLRSFHTKPQGHFGQLQIEGAGGGWGGGGGGGGETKYVCRTEKNNIFLGKGSELIKKKKKIRPCH